MSSVPLAAAAPGFYPKPMTGKGGKSGDSRRAERLKTALRDNLKRRKAQLKARALAVSKHDSAGIAQEIADDKPKG
jgi:hypothetical protein